MSDYLALLALEAAEAAKAERSVHQMVDKQYLIASAKSFGMDPDMMRKIADRAYVHANGRSSLDWEEWNPKKLTSSRVPWPNLPYYSQDLTWYNLLGHNLYMLGLLGAYPEVHPGGVAQ